MIYLTRAVYKIRRTTPKRKPRSVSWDIDHRRLEYKTAPEWWAGAICFTENMKTTGEMGVRGALGPGRSM